MVTKNRLGSLHLLYGAVVVRNIRLREIKIIFHNLTILMVVVAPQSSLGDPTMTKNIFGMCFASRGV